MDIMVIDLKLDVDARRRLRDMSAQEINARLDAVLREREKDKEEKEHT